MSTPATTLAQDGVVLLLVRTSHPWLVRNDEAIARTNFLREGRFEEDS